MKKLFMILLAASAGVANAQTTSNPFATDKGKKPDQFHKHVMSLLRAQEAPVAQKTTAMKQRVIGEAGKDPAMMLIDSTKVKYVGTNGSTFDYNFMDYNYGYSSFGLTPNYYPYDFSKIDVKHDSLWTWGDDGSGGFDLISESNAQHHSTGLLTQLEEVYYNAGSFDYGDMYANSLDAQGRFARLVYLEDNGSGYDSVGKIVRVYNANNQPAADTIYDYATTTWDLSGMLRYTYNASGKMDSLYQLSSDGMGGWTTDAVYVHTHDNSGRLTTVTGYVDMGGSFTTMVTDTFQYTGSNAFFTTLTEYSYTGSGLDPAIQMSKHINSSSLPDTMWISQYDFASGSWVPMVRSELTYNSNNNPQQQTIYANNGAPAFDLMGTYTYYYEMYDDGTSGVGNTVKNAASITVYPNPATSDINLAWSEADGKKAVIDIINAAGQKVASQSFNWKEKHQKISLGNATPGMYWVIVKNAAGVVTFRQSVVKQ